MGKFLLKVIIYNFSGKKLTLNDLEDLDSQYAKNLNWILENPVEGLELSFTYDTEILGQKVTKELVPNGFDIALTEENKKAFVKSVCEMKMKTEIKEQLEAFLKGFYMIIPRRFLSLFSPPELQLLISGTPFIDIVEMRKRFKYSDYTEESKQMVWLWEILSDFSQRELAAFIFFISGKDCF